MQKVLLFIAFACLFSVSGISQVRVMKPVKKTYPKKTNLSIGGGYTQSVLFLSRNVKENNDAKGYTFQFIYGGARTLRVATEYTYYQSINIEPTWFNIEANTIEVNAHILAKVKNTRAIFYPLFGLSYNHFSGFYTGKNDFLNLSTKYKTNSTVSTNWLGLNVGTGYEQYIANFSFFIEYKMRVGVNDGVENHINIMDVCIGLGLRYTLRVPYIYYLFKGTRNRYSLELDSDKI